MSLIPATSYRQKYIQEDEKQTYKLNQDRQRREHISPSIITIFHPILAAGMCNNSFVFDMDSILFN